MYYVGWWWWFAWFIPMLVILWAAFGWNGRRYGRDDLRRPYGHDRDWDVWGTGRRGSSYRNRGPRNYRRADSRIFEDVSDRLMLEDDLDPSGMEVQVESGRVVLTGTVSSRYEKRLAEQIADSVAGVADVENRLRIGKLEAPGESRGPSQMAPQHP